ncbi:PilZ domain-containing protein [Sulfuricurvum sp.]|uniref:PilZ domain-containing protein n=1 Tax=Sulfuricurvum sp. TaxID=2025608 RepID=UPI00260D9FC1|nr:PilZ domain-containing protein [Sulfuricurvum sp.]MDD2266599.1 PilZ domain-containing protein [Sulfuricurvum sp.]MDD2784308.1 PilZ domain-containing protein [Sulfuricurvum sp.]
MAEKASINVFKSLSHPHFNIQLFRPGFIKAAWKAYSDIVSTPISQSQFQVLIGALFDWLFLEKKSDSDTVLSDIRDLFRNSEEVERFLSDTFYIVLNHYIKSFYGHLGGWSKIVSFSTAIERFVTYAANRLDDESFFLFEDAFINALETLRQKSEAITVLNTYYGVPIQYTAEILHTDTQSVILRVHPLQETAALIQNGIYILKKDQFINDVYASVNPITVEGERLLELKQFDQLQTSLFHRQSIRVQPPKPYSFTIVHPSLTLHCHLYDISIGGIAVTTKHPYAISPLSDVTLIFPPEIMGQSPEVKGKLVFKSSYEAGYKYHFKIETNLQQEGELGKYIARREQELIKKLRDEII